MAYTQEQINSALAAELTERPGTSYENMLNFATSTYGLTPQQVRTAFLSLPAGMYSGEIPTLPPAPTPAPAPALNQVTPPPFYANQNYVTPPPFYANQNNTAPSPIAGSFSEAKVTSNQQLPVNAPPAPIETEPFTTSMFQYGASTPETGGWKNRFTQMPVAESADNVNVDPTYSSFLIKSLREASPQKNANQGISIIPSLTSRIPVTFVPGTGNAFSPERLQMQTAAPMTEQDQLNTQINRIVEPQQGWTVDQATKALADELSLRPGSSYDALRVQALRYPGMTVNLFNQAYQNVTGATNLPGGTTNNTNATYLEN